MSKAVVSESALRELLREALENNGAMGHDAAAPAVNPNPVVDRPSIELDLDPIEVRHLPRAKNELIVMVRNLLDTVDDDQAGELYKGIKRLVGGDEAGKKDFAKATELPPASASDRSIDMDKKNNNMGENKLVNAIRGIVDEALKENNVSVQPTTNTEEEEKEPMVVSELGEAIRHIANEALEEAKKKGKAPEFGDGKFKANQFKKGKAKNEADALPTKGKKKTKTADFGGGELAEAIRYIAAEALAEADGDSGGKLPFGFGKGKFMGGGGFDKSRPGDEDDLEGPPSDTFGMRGGSVDDEFGGPGGHTPLWDPNEDISDPEELEAALAKMTKSAWDPEDEDEAGTPAAGRKSPKPRIDVGTGYGVDGETFEKIGEKLGFTKEAAKKAVETAQERFKVLHDMDPKDLEDLVETGVDEYIAMLAKTGELDDADIKYLLDNADKVMDSDSFREYFSKFVKRAVRDERADTQDDNDD